MPSNDSSAATIRVLALASAPLTIDDLGLGREPDIAVVRLLRSAVGMEVALDEINPDVVLIETELAEENGWEIFDNTITRAPGVRILAITPESDQNAHEHVAGAMRAGALGFVARDAVQRELATAIRSLAAGDEWLPAKATRAVLSDVADDLDVTAEDRQTKLQNIALGFIPLAGGLTAVMSLLWRRYLGQIGVRPVDLAIDPTTRIVDAFFALSLQLGIFGPLLFMGSWLDLLQDNSVQRRAGRWIVAHRRIARIGLSIALVLALSAIAFFAEVVVALFVGPAVAALLLFRALGTDEDLPAGLRISRLNPKHAIAGAAISLVLFLTVLSTEVVVVGPDFGPEGASGLFAPRFLGFRAQPMWVETVDGSRAPIEMLYLGGNADLYVFVDPCNGNSVEYVSVGSSRLVVIDKVSCS